MGALMPMRAMLLSLIVAVASQQVVFQDIKTQHSYDKQIENDKGSLKFNFTSSAPHIFSSLHGLLQEWPNSIVPCKIPTYTSLYHGRRDSNTPPSPEWFGFDV